MNSRELVSDAVPLFLDLYFRAGVGKVSIEAMKRTPQMHQKDTRISYDFISLVETTPQAASHAKGPEWTVLEDLTVRPAC